MCYANTTFRVSFDFDTVAIFLALLFSPFDSIMYLHVRNYTTYHEGSGPEGAERVCEGGGGGCEQYRKGDGGPYRHT